MKVISFCFSVLLSIVLVGCATVGRDFSFQGPREIIIGKTTHLEVLNKFGEPFRVGYNNGKVQWTYGYYKYRVFGETEAKDLVITYDDHKIVGDYIFNSSLELDKFKIMAK